MIKSHNLVSLTQTPDTLFVVSDYLTVIQKLSEMKYYDSFVVYYFALAIEFLRVLRYQCEHTYKSRWMQKERYMQSA